MIREFFERWEVRLSGRDNNRTVRPFDWGLESLDPRFLPEALGQTAEGTGAAFPAAAERSAPGTGRDPRIRTDPKQVLLDYNELAIRHSESFFGSYSTPAYAFDGEWLTFASPIQTRFLENNTVHARYFPVPNKGRPDNTARAVIVLPQWNSGLDGHVAICRLLNRFGIAALRMSLPYHDRRMLSGFERADYLVSPNVGLTLQAIRQSVLECRAALDWLVDSGYRRVGILGTSVGSCIAFLAMAHEPRLAAAVHIHVSSYFGDVVWAGLTTRHVKVSLEQALTKEEVHKVWLAISPNSYVRKIAGDGRARLMITGSYDPTFTPDLARLLFKACLDAKVAFDRLPVPCGHYTLGQAPFKYYAGYLLASYLRAKL